MDLCNFNKSWAAPGMVPSRPTGLDIFNKCLVVFKVVNANWAGPEFFVPGKLEAFSNSCDSRYNANQSCFVGRTFFKTSVLCLIII